MFAIMFKPVVSTSIPMQKNWHAHVVSCSEEKRYMFECQLFNTETV